MPNTANNFARPDSTVDTYPGEYQPTGEDWAEANAHWDGEVSDSGYEEEIANPWDYCDFDDDEPED